MAFIMLVSKFMKFYHWIRPINHFNTRHTIRLFQKKFPCTPSLASLISFLLQVWKCTRRLVAINLLDTCPVSTHKKDPPTIQMILLSRFFPSQTIFPTFFTIVQGLIYSFYRINILVLFFNQINNLIGKNLGTFHNLEALHNLEVLGGHPTLISICILI